MCKTEVNNIVSDEEETILIDKGGKKFVAGQFPISGEFQSSYLYVPYLRKDLVNLKSESVRKEDVEDLLDRYEYLFTGVRGDGIPMNKHEIIAVLQSFEEDLKKITKRRNQ